jgi:dGTPase
MEHQMSSNYQRKREDLEAIEAQILAPYALFSARSRGRVYAEPESASRTAFQRDRDRIIHTTAFRRLEYKTQVFVFYEGDHYRTRLTHTLEVAQLGRALARGLGANEDLTETICLAHDLGHPPFGHAGEHMLNALLEDHGGFNHNTQSYRIVTMLEQRYPGFNGLNLTYETREGMVKHETEYDVSDATDYEPDKRASLEAQIANLADEIAYNAHDLEDGLRAELFLARDLAPLEIWHELQERTGWREPFDTMARHAVIRELIGMMVMDVVSTTAASLAAGAANLAAGAANLAAGGVQSAAGGVQSAEEIQLLPSLVVGYSPAMKQKIRPLKDFLYQRMYRHYRLMRMQAKAERFISEMFHAYYRLPEMLPIATQARLEHAPLEKVITDYIAGMTDRYALDEWEKLFDPYRKA